MHQLSPYIGKLKSSIAAALIEKYSNQGETVVDPFAGSGTVPLEAKRLGRKVYAADISDYARVLCRAKLDPPKSVELAIKQAEEILQAADSLPVHDLRSVPIWVRKFFNGRTLKEAIAFAQVCRDRKANFIFACFLGILHHQRPGFLSFPSSHLVPYLRTKKFPRDSYPEMYRYRGLRSRLIAKIQRAYKRFENTHDSNEYQFTQCSIETLRLPKSFDCLITSPPYMNALDYVRDNRLRLWFVKPTKGACADDIVTTSKLAFEHGMVSLASQISTNLRKGGYCVFVVGEEVTRKNAVHPSRVILNIMRNHAPQIKLEEVFSDDIPDVRRSRRDCKGTKTEHFLVFRG